MSITYNRIELKKSRGGETAYSGFFENQVHSSDYKISLRHSEATRINCIFWDYSVAGTLLWVSIEQSKIVVQLICLEIQARELTQVRSRLGHSR